METDLELYNRLVKVWAELPRMEKEAAFKFFADAWRDRHTDRDNRGAAMQQALESVGLEVEPGRESMIGAAEYEDIMAAQDLMGNR